MRNLRLNGKAYPLTEESGWRGLSIDDCDGTACGGEVFLYTINFFFNFWLFLMIFQSTYSERSTMYRIYISHNIENAINLEILKRICQFA